MAKKISNRSFASEINASVPLQSVAEENNLGYKPLIHDEDENPVSHHRKRHEKLGLFLVLSKMTTLYYLVRPSDGHSTI